MLAAGGPAFRKTTSMASMSYRCCCQCGAPIFACNGFTRSDDMLAAIEGRMSWCKVRELCGRCVEVPAAVGLPKERSNFENQSRRVLQIVADFMRVLCRPIAQRRRKNIPGNIPGKL
jgi:hypothetical protein